MKLYISAKNGELSLIVSSEEEKCLNAGMHVIEHNSDGLFGAIGHGSGKAVVIGRQGPAILSYLVPVQVG